MRISEKVKNIIIVLIIFIFAVLTAHYGLDVHKYSNNVSNILKQDNHLTKKQANLVKCIDGDTAILLINNKETKVRFLAIDTPEVKHPKQAEEAYGKTASKFTCNMLTNAKKIYVSYEPSLTNKDKYKRDLVWVWADDILVQEELIKNSLARVRYIYAKYTYTNKLLKLEKKVQQERVGIWHDFKETHDNNEYIVVFTIDNSSKSSIIKNNYITDIIDNPSKKGYTFTGWTYNNKLFDLSQKITSDIVLEPKYTKN